MILAVILGLRARNVSLLAKGSYSRHVTPKGFCVAVKKKDGEKFWAIKQR